MNRARWDRVALALAGRPGPTSTGSLLCTGCRDLLPGTGIGITIASGAHRSQLCASDELAAGAERLQFTLGEGPSVDAFFSDRPVLEADLTTAGADGRWPAFVGPAVELGARAVFAFPLRLGAAHVGVLTLYRDRQGALPSDVHVDALVAAAVVTQSILVMQAGATPDALADGLADAGTNRAEVYQASGMVSAQLNVDIVDALVRLRSFAFASGRALEDVAAEVIARRLRLDA